MPEPVQLSAPDMSSPSLVTVKLPETLLASLGATPADFAEKFNAVMAAKDKEVADARAAATSANATTVTMSTAQSALDARLATLEAKLAAIPKIELGEVAKMANAEASRVTMEILAKSGGSPLAAATNSATENKPDFASAVRAKMDSAKLSKAAAILATIKDEPALHAEWLKSGKTGSL